ncbi:hypothetical protein Droror1_Dr00022595 [Drosera rotundifolia]
MHSLESLLSAGQLREEIALPDFHIPRSLRLPGDAVKNLYSEVVLLLTILSVKNLRCIWSSGEKESKSVLDLFEDYLKTWMNWPPGSCANIVGHGGCHPSFFKAQQRILLDQRSSYILCNCCSRSAKYLFGLG